MREAEENRRPSNPPARVKFPPYLWFPDFRFTAYSKPMGMLSLSSRSQDLSLLHSYEESVPDAVLVRRHVVPLQVMR